MRRSYSGEKGSMVEGRFDVAKTEVHNKFLSFKRWDGAWGGAVGRDFT